MAHDVDDGGPVDRWSTRAPLDRCSNVVCLNLDHEDGFVTLHLGNVHHGAVLIVLCARCAGEGGLMTDHYGVPHGDAVLDAFGLEQVGWHDNGIFTRRRSSMQNHAEPVYRLRAAETGTPEASQ